MYWFHEPSLYYWPVRIINQIAKLSLSPIWFYLRKISIVIIGKRRISDLQQPRLTVLRLPADWDDGFVGAFGGHPNDRAPPTPTLWLRQCCSAGTVQRFYFNKLEFPKFKFHFVILSADCWETIWDLFLVLACSQYLCGCFAAIVKRD